MASSVNYIYITNMEFPPSRNHYHKNLRIYAPCAGMRGKKDTLLDEMQYLMSLRDAEERLQNERRLLGEFARQYQQFEQTPIDIGGGAPIKRAPSSGFFGMRGKKFDDEQQESSSWDDDGAHQKRAGGFVGMRGKKWSDGDGYQRDEDGYDAADEGMVKRAPSLGFHGIDIE